MINPLSRLSAPMVRLAGLSLIAALAGCSSVSLDQASGGSGAPIQSREAQIGGGAASAVPASKGAAAELGPSDRPINPQTLQAAGYNAQGEASIYFEFNQPSIRPDYQPLLANTAEMLKANPQALLRIEGNADDRGTVEYNLALGQRRSDAVREAMMVLGIGEDQLEAVSFGEERPRARGQTEADHAENRRADLLLKASR